MDHYFVFAKIKIKDRLEYDRKNGKKKVSKVVANERMDRKEVKEYDRKVVCKRMREARLTVQEEF